LIITNLEKKNTGNLQRINIIKLFTKLSYKLSYL